MPPDRTNSLPGGISIQHMQTPRPGGIAGSHGIEVRSAGWHARRYAHAGLRVAFSQVT